MVPPPPVETSQSGRRKLIKMSDPKAFIRNLYDAFIRCRTLEKDGSSKHQIGWIFYKQICELFDEDYAKRPTTKTERVAHPPVDPHVDTAKIDLPIARPIDPPSP